MNELKILHTSDWHLGVTSWTGSKPVDRTSEILKALDEIYSKTLEFQPDVVLITGDILHVRKTRVLNQLNPLSNISRISRMWHLLWWF